MASRTRISWISVGIVAGTLVSVPIVPASGQITSLEPESQNPQADHVILSPDTFSKWRDYLSPAADETRWLEIAWRGSFWEGVQDAQVEGKPVLLWAMNGHPMGCT